MMNVIDFNSLSKKRVLLRGPFLTQSGYGVHSRQIARWILQKDVKVDFQVTPWGNTPWILNETHENGLIGQIINQTVDSPKHRYDVTIQVQLPNEWEPSLGEYNVGVTAGVETDRCNPEWVMSCNRMSHVVVPSQHSLVCLKNSGVLTCPVSVVPESYHDSIATKQSTDFNELCNLSTDFNFLLFGQLTGNNPENDRKNIFYAIKWLCEVFKDDSAVGIVLKTNAGRNTTLDKRSVSQMLHNLVREVRKSEFPKIHFLHGDMSNEDVSSLYRHPKIKALLTATRGEGFGLPILEAAAAGLPVIATNWSGHTDFMSRGKYTQLDYALCDVHPTRIDDKIFVGGSKWAQVKEEDFKKQVRRFRESPDVPRQWATSLQKTIVTEYSFDAIAKRYDDALGKYVK